MKFENLKASLQQEIKPAYFIGGEDSFLLYWSLDLIEKACNLNFADFNKVIFSGEGFDATAIVESAQVMPIGDQKRLIVVKDYLNKKNEKEKKIIVDYLKNPVDTTCIVFFASNTNDFYMSFVNNVEYVDCSKLTPVTVGKWVTVNFARANKKITPEALKTLTEFCSYSLTKLNSEINKLIAYVGDSEEVNTSDILQIVSKDAEYVIFELTEALSKKDGTTAYKIIDKLLEGKDTPTSIIAIITNHFRRLFYTAITTGQTNSELAKNLNVKEFAIVKAKEQAKMFTKLNLKNIYDLCLSVDYQIKSGGMEGVNALNYLVANILNI